MLVRGAAGFVALVGCSVFGRGDKRGRIWTDEEKREKGRKGERKKRDEWEEEKCEEMIEERRKRVDGEIEREGSGMGVGWEFSSRSQ